MIRIRVFEMFWFAYVQFDLSLDMYRIQIMHTKSQIFIIFKILWDFSFHLAWINNTHGSYFTDSYNWLKASWLSLNIIIGLSMLKTNQFKLDSEMVCNDEWDSINESKWKQKR